MFFIYFEPDASLFSTAETAASVRASCSNLILSAAAAIMATVAATSLVIMNTSWVSVILPNVLLCSTSGFTGVGFVLGPSAYATSSSSGAILLGVIRAFSLHSLACAVSA